MSGTKYKVTFTSGSDVTFTSGCGQYNYVSVWPKLVEAYNAFNSATLKPLSTIAWVSEGAQRKAIYLGYDKFVDADGNEIDYSELAGKEVFEEAIGGIRRKISFSFKINNRFRNPSGKEK